MKTRYNETPAKHRDTFRNKNFGVQHGSNPVSSVCQAEALSTEPQWLNYTHTKWSNKVEICQNLKKKPETAQFGAISKAQKQQKHSEVLRKRYIRTLKTLYPNFENVLSEL